MLQQAATESNASAWGTLDDLSLDLDAIRILAEMVNDIIGESEHENKVSSDKIDRALVLHSSLAARLKQAQERVDQVREAVRQ